MDSIPPVTITFSNLMAAVGLFLFHWSGLEQGLTAAIKDARSRLGDPEVAVRGTIKERLEVWANLASMLPRGEAPSDTALAVRDQALRLREVRNLIVHGLEAGMADPNAGEAFIRCAVGGYENPTGETVGFTLRELEHFTQAIDACRRAFVRLDHFNYRLSTPA